MTNYVTVVFEHADARAFAEKLLLAQLGNDVLLIAPPALCPQEWIAQWGANARDVVLQMNWRDNHSNHIEILARSDALHVIRSTHPDPSTHALAGMTKDVAHLIGLAELYRVPYTLYDANGTPVLAPCRDPQLQELTQRIAEVIQSTPSSLREADEVHVCCDFYASGLWNVRGQMLGVDPNIMPFALIRRLSAWQWDYDRTFNPPEAGDPAWWAQNFAEGCAIARELQSVLGESVKVKVDYPDHGWIWIDELAPDTNELMK